MAATDGALEPGILDGIRIVDLSDGIAGPVATLHARRGGCRRRRGRTTGWRREPRHQRVPHLDAQQAQRGARPRPGRRPRRARPAARRRRRRRAQPRTDARTRARPRRRVVGDTVPAADRVVGAGVAHEPRRRRPARRRAADDGAPRGARRAAGLPRRTDLPALPDRELVRVAPRGHRHRRPAHHPPAHRPRRARAHVVGPGRARPDGDALAPGRAPVAVVGDRDAQGHDRRDVVRDRRRRVDPPDGRPDQVADVHRGDRGGAARRSAPGPGHVVPADRRLAGGAAAAPERRVAGVVLGQRRARAAGRAARRDLRRRAGAHQRVRDRGRPPRAREDRDGGLAGDGHAADPHARVRARTRCAHRRGAVRVGAASSSRTTTGPAPDTRSRACRWSTPARSSPVRSDRCC